MGRCIRLFFALGLAAWFEASGAYDFQWKFTGSGALSTTLTQCGSYSLMVQNRTGNASEVGFPPYYLIAFKPSGIPTTSLVGTSATNLSWTVNQPSGSSLLLSVVDSQGVSGGQPPQLYTVSDGDSSCLPATSSVNITLGANITKSVSTCEAMGFRVYGGKKPYNITLAAPNSPVLTNVSMGPTDDVFTYIDRADPNSNLLVAVYDADGVWGTGSELFATTGAAVTNQSCIGLVSSTGNSSTVDQHPKQPGKSHAGTIAVAVVVPVVVVALLVAGAFMLWRRRRQAALREPEPAFLPDAWQGPSTYTENASSTFSPYDPPPNSKLARYRDDVSHERSGSSPNIGMSVLSPNRPPSEALSTTAASGSGSGGAAPVPTRSSSTSKGTRLVPNRPNNMNEPQGSRLPPGVSPEWSIERNIEPDIIIQHRDGGRVQEIPPPYVDAAAGSSLNPTTNSGGGDR